VRGRAPEQAQNLGKVPRPAAAVFRALPVAGCRSALDGAEIVAQSARVVRLEAKLRHVGMAYRNAALLPPAQA